MFDPNNVESLDGSICISGQMYVSESAYGELLELYRALKRPRLEAAQHPPPPAI
jgi:hypothetical protein